MKVLLLFSRWSTFLRNQKHIFNFFDRVIVFSSSNACCSNIDDSDKFEYHSYENLYGKRTHSNVKATPHNSG